MRASALAVACMTIVACNRNDRSNIEKPHDPAPSTGATVVDTKPHHAKGRCLDGAYEKEAPEPLGLLEPAFQSQSVGDGAALGPIAGTTPPPPPPYSLVITTESAPPGADPDDGGRVICNRFDAVRRCFDDVRSKISMHEFVTAHVAVDAEGDATKVTKVGDETLQTCLSNVLKVTNLPKPGAAGTWVWRLAVMPPPSTSDASSTIDASSLEKVVRASSSKVRKCYETALKAGGAPSGKILVAFTVEPSGDVTKAHAASGGTITDPALVSCVVGVVSSMHFPEPATGAGDVVVPFNLVSK